MHYNAGTVHHATHPCHRSGSHLYVSPLLHFHRRSSHFLRHGGICWWGLGLGTVEFGSSLGFPWQFQATCGYLPPYELLPFCMSGQHIIISSVSPWIFHAFPNVLAAPSQRKNFVEPGHARILAWLSFLLACHITQVPCSGTTNSADLEVIKHRVHHGWLVLLNAKFGQVLWSRNQEDLFIYSYSLWCMGRMGMVPQLFLKSIHLLSGPR